jgi:AraC-like DNA-binding protein
VPARIPFAPSGLAEASIHDPNQRLLQQDSHGHRDRKWTNSTHSLYKTRMMAASLFIESLHHVPEAGWTHCAYTVLRAGKVSAAPDYQVSRAFHVGQDILYCLTGGGFIETLGQEIRIGAGELGWIGNERPHGHRADPADPWTLLWFRLEGPAPAAIREKLFGEGLPRVAVPEAVSLQSWFDRLFAAMRSRPVGLDLRLNQLVGEFLAVVDQARWGAARERVPEALDAAMLAMRADLGRSWNGDDLAALTGVSPSHLRRLFGRHLRTSPHRWLLRERLMHAQALIADSAMPLAEIAEICGFCDVYHFSREFRRSVGTPPAAWRRTERGTTRLSERQAWDSGSSPPVRGNLA